MATASWSSCEDMLQLIQQELSWNALAIEYTQHPLTLVSYITLPLQQWHCAIWYLYSKSEDSGSVFLRDALFTCVVSQRNWIDEVNTVHKKILYKAFALQFV